MDNKLKPCPFCGGKAIQSDCGYGLQQILCCDCGAHSGFFPTILLARAAWNKQVSPFTLDELDAIRRMFAERYPRARKLSEIEQSIIRKCNYALARREQ